MQRHLALDGTKLVSRFRPQTVSETSSQCTSLTVGFARPHSHNITLVSLGSVIFACHSVSSDSRSPSETTALLQHFASSYMAQGPQYYPSTTSYDLPSVYPPYYSSQGTPSNSQPNTTQISSPTSGDRASGNPPIGVLCCSSCKATTSPEWRIGPSGKEDLCNAYAFHFVLMRVLFSYSRFVASSCGLRYARSRAKKEGIATQRRRKDKAMAMTKQEPWSTSVAPVSVPYNNMRHGSYDDTFLFNSAGSASGNEAYSQSESMHSHSNFDLTPSPSPPASTVPFSYYNLQSQGTCQNDLRGHYAVQSGSIYPCPLSHPPLQSQGLSHTPSPVPPLPLVLNRASPILSSSSSDSALSSAVPASFERDRHRKPVTLPQVPLSEPRRVPTNKRTFVTP